MTPIDAIELVREVLANPTDEAIRLVLADWLDETNQPSHGAWAEYLRANTSHFLNPTLAVELANSGRIRASLTLTPQQIKRCETELLNILPIENLRLDLKDFVAIVEIAELVPESVARENVVIPVFTKYSWRDHFELSCWHTWPHPPSAYYPFWLAMAYPNRVLHEKLEFILNRPIILIAANTTDVLACIDRTYGTTSTESIDSVLYEFTDSPPSLEF